MYSISSSLPKGPACFRCIGTLVCIVGVSIPLLLVIASIVLFAWPDRRQDRINEFNRVVDEWESGSRQLYTNVKASSLNSTAGPLTAFQGRDPWISIDHLASSHDHPRPKDYVAYFYQSDLHLGRKTYDAHLPPLGVYFDYLEGRARRTASDVLFRTTSTHFEPTCNPATSFDLCPYARARCAAAHGTYAPTDLFHDNCFWYYYLREFCALVDASTGGPASAESSSSSSSSSGCYYEDGSFKYGPSPLFAYSSYLEAASSSQVFGDFVVSFVMRSKDDPLVALNRITEGAYDFGVSKFVLFVVAGALLGLAAVVLVVEVVLLVLARRLFFGKCCPWIGQRLGYRPL